MELGKVATLFAIPRWRILRAVTWRSTLEQRNTDRRHRRAKITGEKFFVQRDYAVSRRDSGRNAFVAFFGWCFPCCRT